MKKFFYLGTFFLLFSLVFPILAQEDQTIELEDGYVISLPEDWEEVADRRNEVPGVVYEGSIDGDDLSIQILTPAEVADLVEVDQDTEAVLVDLLAELYEAETESGDFEELDLTNPTLAWGYDLESGDEGASYLIEFDDETFGFLDIYGENFDDHTEAVEAIASSFGVPSEADDEEVVADPCFVSVDTDNTARLRVGPGENRTSVAFLASGEDFQVQGRIVLDDDSVWFKLDKEKAAPGRTVNEIWVAETDVETDGDCENVADASAPPVIPVTPRTTGGDNNSGGGDDNSGGDDGGTEVGQVPNNGRWTITLDATTNASCTGSQNVSGNTSDIFPTTTFTYNLTVAPDKQSFVFGGDTFTILQPGAYNGSFTFFDGTNAQMRLNVQNPNFMTGQLTYNFTLQGVGCSATVFLSVSRG